MIIPRNRLLYLVGSTILPVTLLAAIAPTATMLAWLTFAVIVTISLVDAMLAPHRGRSLQVCFPERVSIIRHRDEILEFRVQVESSVTGTFLIALGLPTAIHSPWNTFRFTCSKDGTGAQIRWPIIGSLRGDHALSGCTLCISSRLGLWYKKISFPADTRILVYPDLLAEQRKAASFLSRKRTGIHACRQVGQGRDFDKLRDYVPGDSMGDIHWRVTAKRGRLATKEYQVERTQEIYAIIDASRLSTRILESRNTDRCMGRDSLLESYIHTALILGNVAQRQGDKFGLIAFNNRTVNFIRAGGGKAHSRSCMDSIINLHAEAVTPDFEELATFLLLNLRRRSLLLFLTSLDDPTLAQSFMQSMVSVSRRHLMVVNMVRPESAMPLFTNGEVTELDDVYCQLGGHMLWHSLNELALGLRRYGIDFSLVNSEEMATETISRYLTIKRRQIL